MDILKKSKWEMLQFQIITLIFTIAISVISGDYMFLTLNVIPAISFIVGFSLYKHIKKEEENNL